MTDLQRFIDMPLDAQSHDRINNIFLPMGRRPTRRQPKDMSGIDEKFMPKVSRKTLKDMAEKSRVEGLGKVLDYYAGTSVPVERVAKHTGLTLEVTKAAMLRRGRTV